MKHNLETLTTDFTQAELERVKKELHEELSILEFHEPRAKRIINLIKEILGK